MNEADADMIHTLVPDRRSLLRVGGAGLLGLTLPQLLRGRAGSRKARAKAVIFLHQWGGPPATRPST